MTQSKFKLRYDPDLDKYVRKNIYDGSIYGAGITEAFKSIGRNIFGRTVKNAAKSAAKSAAKKAATTRGQYVGKKAGDKIVKLLSKNKTVTPSIRMEPKELTAYMEPKQLTAYEVNQRVNQILSGGRLRKKKNFYLNI